MSLKSANQFNSTSTPAVLMPPRLAYSALTVCGEPSNEERTISLQYALFTS